MVHHNSSGVNPAASGAPLGNRASIASPDAKKSSPTPPVVLRFYRQSLARELLMGERVAKCMRCRQALRPTVDLYKNSGTGRAHFSGLQTCRSVWHCPVCSARISEGRRQELKAALPHAHITEPDGSAIPLFAALVTYTFQHNLKMRCASGVDGILSAYRRLKSGKGYQNIKDEYGLVGSVRSLENMYGIKFGWHPHIHELMLFDRPLTPAMLHGLEKDLRPRWLGVLAKEGLTGIAKYAVDIDYRNSGSAAASVLEYIAKFGKEPAQKSDGWGITEELTKSGSKTSAKEGHYAMLELLDMYGEGDIKAGRLWREYAMAMKGRNQLVWSRGLRDLLGIGEEKTDGDLAVENESPADELLARFTPDQWRAILKADVRGEVIVKAENLSEEDFNRWLADLLGRWMPASEGGGRVVVRVAADGSYELA